MTESADPSDRLDDVDELRELIGGLSDDEVNAVVDAKGVDRVLDRVFEGMQARFRPERAQGQEAVAQWEVTAPDGPRVYQLKVSDGACSLTKGAVEPPRVTLQLSLPNFLRLITGELDGMRAFMTRKLKVSGDLVFAPTMQSWFGR
jgi:putative sterol carrier protein